MNDPAHLADDLMRVGFSPFFAERLPPHVGSELFKLTHDRLKLEGFSELEHAQEVFARTLAKGLEYLHKHGGPSVRQPRAWLHEICRNEMTRYLTEMAAHDTGSLLSLLEGETDLLNADLYSSKTVDAILRKAIQQLTPRHRELIVLDLIKGIAPAEIEASMGIHSHDYFLKLKCEAFSALKHAVLVLIEKGIASLI